MRLFRTPRRDELPHHAADKTRQTEILAKAQRQRQEASIPDIEVDLSTIDGCLKLRADLAKFLITTKRPDFRRVEALLKLTNGASGDHSVRAIEEQNKILISLSGHGAGLAMLERLRSSKMRVLPGRRATHLEVIPASDKPDPSPTPTETEEASNAHE